MKNVFLVGLLTSIFSSIINLGYLELYNNALGNYFDKILNTPSVIGFSTFSSMLYTVGYILIFKLSKEKLAGILNILYVILVCVSVVITFSLSLPLDIEAPELFVGLVVPIMIFPAFLFLALQPFLNKKLIKKNLIR